MSTDASGPGRSTRRRRPLVVWALFALFVLVPLVEIYVIIQVGQTIGPWWTILLLVLDSILGSWLIKREGSRAFAALRAAIDSGRMPARELADGGLILVGGTLMLAPGFVTDAFGILMILPFTRPFFRGVLTKVVASRFTVLGPHGPLGAAGPFGPGPGVDPRTARRLGSDPEGPVVRGEVVDE